MTRKEELSANLGQVQKRIAQACAAANRDVSEIELIVVTKTYPASDVVLLSELGVRNVGENKHPEAQIKKAEAAVPNVRWHYLGGLQSNKAAVVASYADVIHSVDRLKLLPGLAKGAPDSKVDCFVQVRLSETEGRAGIEPENVHQLADELVRYDNLRLVGVMGVAPLGLDPTPSFELLARIAKDLEQRFSAPMSISAGMSDDLEKAVLAGATHLRIGRAILGERPKMP